MMPCPFSFADPIPELEDKLVSFYDEPLLIFSATQRKETSADSPFNIRRISRAEIESYGLDTLKDLLLYLENTFVAMKGVDDVFGVRGIMGYANDKIKFLINGMEFPMMLGLGEGEFPVTLDEVKEIEIIKGPNTSIYGGNATQATINVIPFNGSDFQGVRTGLGLGSYHHERAWLHFADQPFEDFHYDLYANFLKQDGYDFNHHAYWYENNYADLKETRWNSQNREIPLPDHELLANASYKDVFQLMYRRVEEAPFRFRRYVRDSSDAIALNLTRHDFGDSNTDLNFRLEASVFGQQYDCYHINELLPPEREEDIIENKRESRFEWETTLHNEREATDLILGIGGNYWHAEGAEWGKFRTTTVDPAGFNYAVDLKNSKVSDEYFPSFTEINDLADLESWFDLKWKPLGNVDLVFGGRYVYDFIPDNQLRDEDSRYALYRTERELLRDFFPKTAIVLKPKENLVFKLIYQEGFNRPNTFEQFSMQTNVNRRGSILATTGSTYEFVCDWILSERYKGHFSLFTTEVDHFTNFVYTGDSFPTIEPGDLIGFHNVGQKKVEGLEVSLEAKYKKTGGMLNLGTLFKNRIDPDPLFYPQTGAQTGATGIIDDSDFNQQTFPKTTISAGVWAEPFSCLRLSVLSRSYLGVKNNFDKRNYSLPFPNLIIHEDDYHYLDLIANLKDFPKENLNIQFKVQNIFNDRKLLGDVLNPVQAGQSDPIFFLLKISYLWK